MSSPPHAPAEGAPDGQRDSTERLRNQLEELTRAAESRRALLEAMPDAISVFSRDGTLLDFKGARDVPTAVVDPRAFIGKKLSDPALKYLPTAQLTSALARAFETRETQHLDFEITIDGTPRARESSLRAISDHEAVWVSRDVTRHRDTVRRLHESEVKLRVAVGAARIGLFDWDIQRDRFEWDDTLCAIYGVTQETRPRDRVAFRAFVHPDDRERVRTLTDASVRSGVYQAMEYRIVRRDGTVRWTAVRGALTRAEDGSPSKLVGGVLDVTDERALDERRLQSQKLEAIGQLSAGIAHNFNNMLMGIIPNLEMALPTVSPETAELLQTARDSALRAAELVRQLMTFAGQTQSARRRTEDMLALVGRTVQICRRVFDGAIDLSVVAPEGPLPVLADDVQLEQALLNVLINARDAVTDARVHSPSVRVTIEAVTASGPEVARCDLTPGAEYVRVSTADNGPGMDEPTQARIFDPFFTTKDVGRGTGLGLSTAIAIVRDHGGSIACVSAPGAGTTFSVYVPRAPAVAAEASAPSAVAAAGSETILVVDDERAIREVVRRILEQYGYEVRVAASGEEALELLGDPQVRSQIALVLLDMSMPSMPGVEVRRHIKALAPGLRVAYFTGYSQETPDDGDGVIEKPVTRDQLRLRVREILDRP